MTNQRVYFPLIQAIRADARTGDIDFQCALDDKYHLSIEIHGYGWITVTADDPDTVVRTAYNQWCGIMEEFGRRDGNFEAFMQKMMV